MAVKRFDCIERILRFVNVFRPRSSVILFFPSQSSSNPVRVSMFSIAYIILASCACRSDLKHLRGSGSSLVLFAADSARLVLLLHLFYSTQRKDLVAS